MSDETKNDLKRLFKDFGRGAMKTFITEGAEAPKSKPVKERKEVKETKASPKKQHPKYWYAEYLRNHPEIREPQPMQPGYDKPKFVCLRCQERVIILCGCGR